MESHWDAERREALWVEWESAGGDVVRTCRYRGCLKPFSPRRWWAEYCSPACRQAEHRKRKTEDARREILATVEAALKERGF